MFYMSFMYLLFVCAIRFESKMWGAILLGDGVVLLMGANFQARERFFSPQTSPPGRFYFTKGATFLGERGDAIL